MRRGTPAARIFGEYLYDLRTDAKLSMRQLATKIGTTPATISQMEKGERALKEEKLSIWADALGVGEKQFRWAWGKVQRENPDPPIVRTRSKSIKSRDLELIISKLTSPERDRVLGYIDALIEMSRLNDY